MPTPALAKRILTPACFAGTYEEYISPPLILTQRSKTHCIIFGFGKINIIIAQPADELLLKQKRRRIGGKISPKERRWNKRSSAHPTRYKSYNKL